LENGH